MLIINTLYVEKQHKTLTVEVLFSLSCKVIMYIWMYVLLGLLKGIAVLNVRFHILLYIIASVFVSVYLLHTSTVSG